MSKEAAAAAVQAKGDEIRAAKAAKKPKEVHHAASKVVNSVATSVKTWTPRSWFR